jgi:LmbE family N-acetylglucosaminyl deacetylase
MKALADAGHRVIVVSLTKGEFGTTAANDDLKGPKLGRIRTRELLRAAKAHGVDQITYLGAADGFAKVNKETFTKLEEIIEREQPVGVFSPEAYLTYYWHPDHLVAAWLAYFAVKHLRQREGIIAPKLFYFTTMRNEIRVPFASTKHGLTTLRYHASQWYMMKFVSLVYGLLYRAIAFRVPRAHYAEGFRRIRFQPGDFTPRTPIDYFTLSIGKLFQKIGDIGYYNVHGQRPAFLDDLLAGKVYAPEEMSFNLRQSPKNAG